MRSFLAIGVLLVCAAPTFAAPEQEATQSSFQQSAHQEKKVIKEEKKKPAEGNEAKVSGDAKGADLNTFTFTDLGAKGTEFGGLSSHTFDGESKNKSAALGEIPYNSYRSKPSYIPEKPTQRLSDDRPPVGRQPSIRTQDDQAQRAAGRRYQSKYKKPHHEPEDIQPLRVRPVHIGENSHGGRDLSGHGAKGSPGKGKKSKKPKDLENQEMDEEFIRNLLNRLPRGNAQDQATAAAPSQVRRANGPRQGVVGARGAVAGNRNALNQDEVVPSIMDDLRNHRGFNGGFRSSLRGLDLRDDQNK